VKKKQTEWEYQTIPWNSERFDSRDHPDQILVTEIYITYKNGLNLEASDYKKLGGVSDISGLLNVIGHNGWELVCFDGKNYIVKRPTTWTSGRFYVSDEWEDIPKTR
jgi:hypothetical protein